MFMGPSSTTAKDKSNYSQIQYRGDPSLGFHSVKGMKHHIMFNCKSRCYILFTNLNAGFTIILSVRSKLAFQFVQRPYCDQ